MTSTGVPFGRLVVEQPSVSVWPPVPEQWAAYTKANVDFFDELGSPGGASKVGKSDFDVEPAKSLPPQQHDE